MQVVQAAQVAQAAQTVQVAQAAQTLQVAQAAQTLQVAQAAKTLALLPWERQRPGLGWACLPCSSSGRRRDADSVAVHQRAQATRQGARCGCESAL
jgi:uncharacterized protein YqiB (DUF1249 family)